MKEFIFISDFDGTLTERDFYYIVLDEYLGETGRELYRQWGEGKLKDIEFLTTLFGSIGRSESEILKSIAQIQFDRYASRFIEHIQRSGGDFVVLSAGASYYIEKVLQMQGVKNVQIIANPAVYAKGGIQMHPPVASPFYSEFYGINKELVVQSFKRQYEKVYFAGDSTPDVGAALSADLAFARGKLIRLLEERQQPFVPVQSFAEIETYFLHRGFLKN